MEKREKPVRLFGEEWEDSLGQANWWVFTRAGDEVIFTFHVLVDGELFDYQTGLAAFPLAAFTECLVQLREEGSASFTDGTNALELKRLPSSVSISVRGRRGGLVVSTGTPPASVYEQLPLPAGLCT